MLSQFIAVNFTNKDENSTACFSHVAILLFILYCNGMTFYVKYKSKLKYHFFFYIFK